MKRSSALPPKADCVRAMREGREGPRGVQGSEVWAQLGPEAAQSQPGEGTGILATIRVLRGRACWAAGPAEAKAGTPQEKQEDSQRFRKGKRSPELREKWAVMRAALWSELWPRPTAPPGALAHLFLSLSCLPPNTQAATAPASQAKQAKMQRTQCHFWRDGPIQ